MSDDTRAPASGRLVSAGRIKVKAAASIRTPTVLEGDDLVERLAVALAKELPFRMGGTGYRALARKVLATLNEELRRK